MKIQNSKLKKYLPLHILIFVYALAALFSKLASFEAFLSLKYIAFYSVSILCLGVYAILWQQILKAIPLSTAFANKGATIIWGMLFGVLVFNEHIKWNMLVGAFLVFLGILTVVKSDE